MPERDPLERIAITLENALRLAMVVSISRSSMVHHECECGRMYFAISTIEHRCEVCDKDGFTS